MSEPKLISPMLDNFAMGDPVSEHHGVRCCPAMENETDEKYIVKIISTPASQTQVEALLLSGAFADNDAAMAYYNDIAQSITEEAQVLQKLSQLEGFMPYESWQIEPIDEGVGYDIYLLSRYRKTLQRYFQRNPITHLGALNLGLDLCAALAVCRRMGYIYVDLKPENVYLTDKLEYRIGDIGFIKLDSLKYASLPERYRSDYTAPEITDAYSALNSTIDVYALGLILYQAFNNGIIPEISADNNSSQLPPPTYADYEMSEIILKACAMNPEDRYQDPIEMGQALVSYMQRNGAHDTPIVPQAVVEEEPAEDETGVYEETPVETDSEPETTDEEQEEYIPVEEEIAPTEEYIFTEDEEGNLTVITEDSEDETAPDQEDVAVDYEEVTEEVSDILNQADELIAHPAPDPVVQPEAIEVTLPEVLPEEETEQEYEQDADGENLTEESAEESTEDTEDSEDAEDAEKQPCEPAEEVNDAAENVEDAPTEESEAEPETKVESSEDVTPVKKRGGKKWLIGVIVAVLVAALAVVGFLFYKNYYLQEIQSIVLETSDKGSLTVTVSSDVDENKLTVICLDAYGNQITAPVENGRAVFTGLAPNSAYTIKVVIGGFHRLTGNTIASFTTPRETQVVQFQAVTGSEDGSVILSFTVEGPESNEWNVSYSCANEEAKDVTFSGRMVALTGLTVGNEYTFTLTPMDDITLTGSVTTTYTASKIIKAEDLFIMGRVDGKLTAQWSAPSGITVNSWTVRCYNDSGYDQTIITEQPNAVFEGVDNSAEYTVEVTAAGMSVSERAFAPANAINVTNFSVDNSNSNKLVLSWSADTESEWLLYYTVDGYAEQQAECSDNNTAIVDLVIPGGTYRFTLKAESVAAAFGGNLIYTAAAAEAFDNYGVSKDAMEFMMCETPSYSDWDRWDLSDSDYRTEFAVGEKASFLVHITNKYGVSSDEIVTLFAIRDSSGKLISVDQQVDTWRSMWYRNYGEFDLPSLPQSAGEYIVEVYFNGALACSQSFTIS